MMSKNAKLASALLEDDGFPFDCVIYERPSGGDGRRGDLVVLALGVELGEAVKVSRRLSDRLSPLRQRGVPYVSMTTAPNERRMALEDADQFGGCLYDAVSKQLEPIVLDNPLVGWSQLEPVAQSFYSNLGFGIDCSSVRQDFDLGSSHEVCLGVNELMLRGLVELGDFDLGFDLIDAMLKKHAFIKSSLSQLSSDLGWGGGKVYFGGADSCVAA